MRLSWLPALALSAACIGCGGIVFNNGGGGGGGTNPPDFSFVVSSGSLSVTAGGSAGTVTLTATALNGFTGTIDVAVSGVPSGVTSSPATLTLTPGTPLTVSFTAASSAASGTSNLVFTATSGSLSHTANLKLSVTAAAPPPGTVDVTTYHDDIARTGLNPSETTLTTANVNSTGFGLIRTLAGDGQVHGEPLYLSGLTVGSQQQNVVYFATENDSVYAYNADTGAQLWKVSVLGSNEQPSGDHGCGQISPQIGVTTTPVIDRSAGPNGAIFLVGMTLDASGNYHQRLHALDITTGAELTGSPTEITATYPGTGDNSSGGNVVFAPGQYAERAGMLLLNGTLYMGWTSHCDGGPYTGWLMAYSEQTLKQTAVLNLTPNGSEGSIWMAGAGLAADSNSYIYFLDANGSFDTTLNASGFPSNSDFGNGFIKVSTASGALAVADYFEMSNTVQESDNDEDLGSGGALVLPDMTDSSGTVHHLAVGAGKDGNIYVVDRDNLGKFNPNNDDAIYQELDGVLNGVWAMPAYFNNTVYYGDQGGTLKAFPITNAKLSTSPAYQTTTSFTYPGATPSVSANGTSNGIVWAVANNSNAVLYAFNAGTLAELYDSTQAAGGRDSFGGGNKFVTPMIVNGKVFVGTPSGVAEFGLLQ
jgi:outer membrane protein assembly factor BamB